MKKRNGVLMIEKIYLEINGVKQGLIVERNMNKNAPVLLFVHGTAPILPFIWKRQVKFNQDFHTCYWDQRWVGMSCSLPDEEAFNIETLTADVLKVTEQLRYMFNQDKIYVLGHSWGSYIASLAVQEKPEYYYAYIGVGQINCMRNSEKEKYQAILKEACRRNDKIALRRFEKLDLPDNFFDTYKINKESMLYGSASMKYTEKYGFGVTREGYQNSKLLKAVFLFPYYTVNEKICFFKGMFQASEKLISQILDTPLQEVVRNIEIPIHIIHGELDSSTSYKEAKRFFHSVDANEKNFYTFSHSAHMPFIDEPDKFMEVLSKVKCF